MKGVRECLSKKVITTMAVQLMAGRAQQYITGYDVLHKMKLVIITGSLGEQLKNAKGFDILTTKIEYIVGEFKSHRAASDFEHGFYRTIFKESKKNQQNSNSLPSVFLSLIAKYYSKVYSLIIDSSRRSSNSNIGDCRQHFIVVLLFHLGCQFND